MTLMTFLGIIVFLIGLYFYSKTADPKYAEGLTNSNTPAYRCPDLLIQNGSQYYLSNSKLAQIPGVNPIIFENLEDYSEFMDWQKSQNITCPVLYLQSSYDAQGAQVYKVRPSVSELQGGLPPSNPTPPPSNMPPPSSTTTPPSIASSSGTTINEGQQSASSYANTSLKYPNPTLLVDATRNDPPYNINSYPAEDQSSYYVGTTTPLDVMDIKAQSQQVSANPMDPNWGGASYTQKLVNNGYYDANNVSVYVD